MEQSPDTRFDWLVYPIPKPFKSKEEYNKIYQKILAYKIQQELFADKIENVSSEEEKAYWRSYATMSDENRQKLNASKPQMDSSIKITN